MVGIVRRLAAVAVVVLSVLVLTVAPASAHSETVRSDPPDGGMVPEGRTTLTLWFDEPVGTAASTFRLGTMAGLDVPTTVTFGDGDEEVLIMTAPLERGEYVLDWHARSRPRTGTRPRGRWCSARACVPTWCRQRPPGSRPRPWWCCVGSISRRCCWSWGR